MRGKGGKKAIFRPENRNGVGTRKTDKEMETACIAAIDTQTA